MDDDHITQEGVERHIESLNHSDDHISLPTTTTVTQRQHHRHQQRQKNPKKINPRLHHDQIAPEALGGLEKDLPPNYYYSARFLGTLVATCLAQISGKW